MDLVKFFPRTDYFNHELSRIFSDPFFSLSEFGEFENKWPTSVNVDIAEDENEIQLKAELPGLSADDFHLDVDGNVLTLSGNKKGEEKKEGKNYYHIERSYGAFSRSFNLPDNTKKSEIKAEFKNGLLNIQIPKTEETRPKKIKVEVN